jgi:xanthine/uracil permease
MAAAQTPVPERFLGRQRQWVASFFSGVVLVSLLLLNAVQLNAVPVLTQTILTNNSIGTVSGSFDGGGNALAALANLADTSAAPREYVSQFFKPVISGTYIFGLS